MQCQLAAYVLACSMVVGAAGCGTSTVADAGGAGGTGGVGATGGTGGAGGSDAGAELQWYRSCGAPVCGPGTDGPTGDPPCTTQAAGQTCSQRDAACDPGLGCMVRLVCTDRDPTLQPGGCPISRARYKRDVHYLDAAEQAALARELRRMPLATWRYHGDASGREQLGFIVEDVEPSPSVEGDHVNLYAYVTMNVAALQEQATRIEALEREVRRLRARRTCTTGTGTSPARR